MPVELDPRVKHFQELKARERIEATKRKAKLDKLQAAFPGKSTSQLLKLEADLERLNTPRLIEVNGRTIQVFEV